MNVRVQLSPRDSHLKTFDEVAETLQHGLRKLVADGVTLPNKSIVLGDARLLSGVQDDLIFYNFEQRDSPLIHGFLPFLRQQREIWDYSPSNVMWLAEQGVKAKHVPLGYVPEMKRIVKVEDTEWPKQDIDVLFYGLVNARRKKILYDLEDAGLRVAKAFNCYGKERDDLIARSKIVLNVHFYETSIFEMVRCSYLFANEVCVVSETSRDIPPELVDAVCFADYNHLAFVCNHLIREPERRKYWATRAHQAFTQVDEAAILRQALGV